MEKQTFVRESLLHTCWARNVLIRLSSLQHHFQKHIGTPSIYSSDLFPEPSTLHVNVLECTVYSARIVNCEMDVTRYNSYNNAANI